MLDRLQSSGAVAPQTSPTPPAAPASEAPKKKPARQGDTLAISSAGGKQKAEKAPDNPYANSPGRTAADVTSTAADVAETGKDIRDVGGIATTLGTRFSRLSRLTTGLADGVEWLATKGEAVGRVLPKVARGFTFLGKAAPIIGVGMAGLDIGKAIAEKDPVKKQIYTGTAAFSTFSSAAGIGGAALLATPLAPLGIGLIAAGIGASVVSFVDTTFFGGKISKAVGGAVNAVGHAAKSVGHAIGNVASKAWHALSSL